MLKIKGVISWYLTCTQTNTRLSAARIVAATMVRFGRQWKAAGTMRPIVHTSSRIPSRHPSSPRQRAEGRDVLAYLFEHEDLHDARRSVQERGKQLQSPQQYVHQAPLGLRVSPTKSIPSPSNSGNCRSSLGPAAWWIAFGRAVHRPRKPDDSLACHSEHAAVKAPAQYRPGQLQARVRQSLHPSLTRPLWSCHLCGIVRPPAGRTLGVPLTWGGPNASLRTGC